MARKTLEERIKALEIDVAYLMSIIDKDLVENGD